MSTATQRISRKITKLAQDYGTAVPVRRDPAGEIRAW